MKQFFKERLVTALEKALEGAERGIWPIQNAPQHKAFLEGLLQEAQVMEPQSFPDWLDKALHIAKLCTDLRGWRDTYWNGITSVTGGLIACTGTSYCCGSSETESFEFPEAYMILTDEEITAEETLRIEAEKRKKAAEEVERKRIMAEEDERRERKLLQELQIKYGNPNNEDLG